MFAPWLEGYIGEKEYGVFRVLKDYFDPDYNMNPGARSAWISSRRRRSSCASTPTISSSRSSTEFLSSPGSGLDARRRIIRPSAGAAAYIACAAGGRTGAAQRPKGMEQPGRYLPGCFFAYVEGKGDAKS